MAIGDVSPTLLPPSTRVQHKWPNDLCQGRKASGILLKHSRFVVLGSVSISPGIRRTRRIRTDLVAGAAPIAPVLWSDSHGLCTAL
jgi:biotin-(acetyl-CoA carboxylase) ligase